MKSDRPKYTAAELTQLRKETMDLHKDITKDIEDGKLEVFKGLIVPKAYANKRDMRMSRENVWHEEDKVYYTNVYFVDLAEPEGPLPTKQEAAALMHYAIKVFRLWHMRTQQLSYEDTPDEIIRYGNIFKSTARAYQVDPDKMPAYWPAVAKAFKILYGKDLPPHIVRADRALLHDYLH